MVDPFGATNKKGGQEDEEGQYVSEHILFLKA
jgi:hypothetical protein